MAVQKWEVVGAGIAEMLRQASVAAHLNTTALAALDYAKGEAPVLTGAYRDSLSVLDVRTEGDSLVAGVGTDIEYWGYLEFGTINNPPFRVLGSAAEAVSDRVEHL
jgi:hypothetical protein